MKDYYDLALLSRMYPFTGELLVAAISATFRHRGTLIEAEPVGLSEAYYEDPRGRSSGARSFAEAGSPNSGAI